MTLKELPLGHHVPQKGVMCLPLTYAPVSFTDQYIDVLKANGSYTYCHHPIMEARHWGIVDGQDVEKGGYHRTHSGYAVAAFHEALRITLQYGLTQRADDYVFHENALRQAVDFYGVRSNFKYDKLTSFKSSRRLSQDVKWN